jgi:hypothetical protein
MHAFIWSWEDKIFEEIRIRELLQALHIVSITERITNEARTEHCN